MTLFAGNFKFAPQLPALPSTDNERARQLFDYYNIQNHSSHGEPVIHRGLLSGSLQDSTGVAFAEEARPGLDAEQMSNYRPISNLTTISKVIEQLVLNRLRPHLLLSKNFARLQSAYLLAHSTETALLQCTF